MRYAIVDIGSNTVKMHIYDAEEKKDFSHLTSYTVHAKLIKYIENGKTKEIRSDDFMNECLRMFNLITKLNHTSHLYDFEIFDIMEE